MLWILGGIFEFMAIWLNKYKRKLKITYHAA